jgi:Fur family transcriptional regulator, peroxide stress response regulator
MQRRNTKKRDTVLTFLKSTSGSLSASEISKKLPGIDLSTIYRNLDFFVSEKLIRKYQFANREAEYEYQTQPHHHAICQECNNVIHFAVPDSKLDQLAKLKNFTITSVDLTVKGFCSKHKI